MQALFELFILLKTRYFFIVSPPQASESIAQVSLAFFPNIT